MSKATNAYTVVTSPYMAGVASVQSACDQLLAAGVSMEAIQDEMKRLSLMTDPNGHPICLSYEAQVVSLLALLPDPPAIVEAK